ncbi:hypothetical protein FN846DRAFT_427938 [Sphaerosporella brunnea]|uniref:Uncharacterized protein n=1 Tax=Sphaerosporella brunnea TaxID=1250544 RepID=A0A5J5F574_9PEZI|nr:hypothetical protein FN846DRAFT_427938 [Sphaerosporella brunnea]
MTNRRPSLFSESRLSRSSIPENMVLGPPKMSFASSSARASGHKFDSEAARSASIASPVFDDDRDESPRFERYKGFGGFVRGDDRDKDSPGARDFSDLRSGFSKRRDDSEPGGWTSVSRPPRKSFGTDDASDRERFRKELRGDGEKKGSPWDRERPAKYENFGKERDRDRDREHRGRGKRDESSWLLDDNRERARNNDREHGRFGSRAEKDPEWLDSDGKSGDGKAAHSMEDFQKWKERMKASAASAETPKKVEEPVEKPATQPEPEPIHEPTPEPVEKSDKPKRQDSNPRDEAEGAFDRRDEPQASHSAENGVDRFFGFWSGNSILRSPEQGDILSPPRTEPRVGKSRFTSFFGPQESQSPPPQMQVKEQQNHLPVNRTPPFSHSPAQDEDREGFQRILKMLGGTNLNGPDSNPSPLSAGLLSRPPQSSISPGINAMNSPHPPPPQAQHNHQYTMPNPARDSNADFLMRLMRGEQQVPQQQPQHQPPHAQIHNKYGGPSQMPPPPPIDTSILQFNRGNHNPLSPNIDDPAVMFRHRPNQDSPINPRGPPHMMDHHGPHGPPPGWNPQQVSQAPPAQSHRQVAPPPGFAGARHQQGPPPPPPFLPPGVNGPPVPFPMLNGINGPLPPNMPPPPHLFMGGMNGMGGLNGLNGLNGGPPLPGSNMNGPPPPGGFQGMPFPPHHHHPDPMLGAMHVGPPFGFPHHDGLKNPPFGHGPPGKGIMR